MAKSDGKEFFEKFRTQWQCFSCKAPPGPTEKKNRYLCSESFHPLCEKCKGISRINGFNYCHCKSRVSDTPCGFMTKMIENFPWYHCYYYENGCREILTEADYEDHLEQCIFRNVYCPYLNCDSNQKIIFKDVVQHTREKHGAPYWGRGPLNEYDNIGWPCCIDASQPMIFEPKLIASKDERTFYFVGFTKPRDLNTHFWIYFAGSPAEAKNYEYTLSLSNEKKELTIRGQPQPLDRHFEDIIKDEDAFCVGKKTLNRFKKKVPSFSANNARIHFGLKIRCLKEEAKDDDVESGVSEGETEQDESPRSKIFLLKSVINS